MTPSAAVRMLVAFSFPVVATGCGKTHASEASRDGGGGGLDATRGPDAQRLPDATHAVFADGHASAPDATVPPEGDAYVGPSDDANIPEVSRGEPPPPPETNFCALPGAVNWSNGLPSVVPGGATGSPDLTWMKLPDGYCAHYFATVPEARQIRVSPSGDVFVSSPGRTTAGGASGGLASIVVLPDDNQDGVADQTITYMSGLVVTQGMLFYDGSFYYQNGTAIYKTPWTSGQRVATGAGEQVINITVYESPDHWAKVLDVDDDGDIYVTNGGDQGQTCTGAELTSDPPFTGGILKVTPGNLAGEQIAKGLRNVYALRCAKGTGACFGLELALDAFGADFGSREKLIPVRKGDNWGFPCCATASTAYTMYTDPAPDCSRVAAEEDSFTIDHTPFGLDFEEGTWTGTFQYRAFVALHGYFGSWAGARVLAIATNPTTGWPETAHETDGGTSTMMDFATGWDDGKNDHGRPAAITFGADGRLYIADDTAGLIVWVAQATGG